MPQKIKIVFEVETDGTDKTVPPFDVAEAVGKLIKYGPFPYRKPGMIYAENEETGVFNGYALDNRLLSEGSD